MATMNFYQAVYQVVTSIPLGRVATYGSVATWLGAPRAARAVGYALAADTGSDVPWHRVVNRLGAISIGGALWRPDEQRRRLEAEGVAFTSTDTVDLTLVRFRPRPAQLKRWITLGESTRGV